MRFGTSTILATLAIASTFAFAACGPKYPNCDEDKHCKDHNQFCVDKLCRDCAVDAHCKDKGPCAFCGGDYTCQIPAGGLGDCCVSDANCKDNGKCYKLPGADRGSCAKCLEAGDCGANFKCVQGSCVPDAECDAGKPCPEGKKCEGGKCVVDICQPDSIYFDFDESAIRSDARDTLNAGYACIQKRGLAPKTTVAIEGNCDERGSDEYNMALGTRRAEAARKFLLHLGLKRNQAKSISYGEERPTCSDASESCWSRNRRVDIKMP